MLLVDDTQNPIAGQPHVRYRLGGGLALAWGVCITDQITNQYAPYCSELRYAVSSDYIELADYWWMQQEMNTVSVRHLYSLYNCFYLIKREIPFSVPTFGACLKLPFIPHPQGR